MILPFNFINPLKFPVQENIRAYAEVSLNIFKKAMKYEVPLTSVSILS